MSCGELVDRALRRDAVERRDEAGCAPGRQPILTAIDDIGRRIAADAQDQAVVVVGPGIVGDVDLDARVLGLELADIVLNGLERVVPDDEFQRQILSLCGRRGQTKGQGHSGQERAAFHASPSLFSQKTAPFRSRRAGVLILD